MRTGTLATFLAVAVAGLLGQGSRDEVLSEERIAVYRAFLSQYDNGSSGPVNLGDRTRVLEISDSDRSGCLKGIDLEESAMARTHPLGSEFAMGGKFRLVDSKKQLALINENFDWQNVRALGLLQISEIAFDRARRYAVLSFGFTCGGLCGYGGIMVFENTAGVWKASNRHCSRWVA